MTDRCESPATYLATDLSPYGLWIATADPMRAGEIVVVCFQPRDGWKHGELMVFAEVCRVMTSRRRLVEPGVGMGLELIDLRDEERAALVAWLAKRRTPVPRRRRPVPPHAGPLSRAKPVAVDGVVQTEHRPLSVCWR